LLSNFIAINISRIMPIQINICCGLFILKTLTRPYKKLKEKAGYKLSKIINNIFTAE